MKWTKVAIPALLFLFMMIIPADAEEGRVDSTHAFILPAQLQSIEESAFEGTAASEVYLWGKVEHIANRAFARMPNLRKAYVPPKVTYIGEDSFSNTGKLTLYGVAGSPIHSWAQKHHYRFVHADIWGISANQNLRDSWQKVKLPVGRIKRTIENQEYFVCQIDLALLLSPKEKSNLYPLDYDFP